MQQRQTVAQESTKLPQQEQAVAPPSPPVADAAVAGVSALPQEPLEQAPVLPSSGAMSGSALSSGAVAAAPTQQGVGVSAQVAAQCAGQQTTGIDTSNARIFGDSLGSVILGYVVALATTFSPLLSIKADQDLYFWLCAALLAVPGCAALHYQLKRRSGVIARFAAPERTHKIYAVVILACELAVVGFWWLGDQLQQFAWTETFRQHPVIAFVVGANVGACAFAIAEQVRLWRSRRGRRAGRE